jgi:hypothetical protein
MMLPNLKGIKDGRTIALTRKKTLDALIGIWERMLDGNLKEGVDDLFNKRKDDSRGWYQRLAHTLFKGISFDAQDLADFIFAKANSEYDYYNSKKLGFYSGLLLSALGRRTRKFKMRINGQGNRFDFLFYYAENFNELTVENFTGDDICNHIGECGHIGFLRVSDMKGDNLCSYAGYNGTIDTLVVDNSEGKDIGMGMGWKAVADTVLLVNNVSKTLGSISFYNAGINFVGIAGNKAENILDNCCQNNSRVKHIVIADNTGKVYTPSFGQVGGKIIHLYYRNNDRMVPIPNHAIKNSSVLGESAYYSLMQALPKAMEPGYNSANLRRLLK